MTTYHTSYQSRKRRRINEIFAKMRAGKERKRLAQDYTPRPDRPKLCMRVVVENYEGPQATTTTYYLQANPARIDSYWIWEGKTRWPRPMGKATFFREVAQRHPRRMTTT